MSTIRVGIVGLGANTRLRHVPGLRACRDVEIIGVCNRSEASTQKAATEMAISKTYERWQDLVADDDIDAVERGGFHLVGSVDLCQIVHADHDVGLSYFCLCSRSVQFTKPVGVL